MRSVVCTVRAALNHIEKASNDLQYTIIEEIITMLNDCFLRLDGHKQMMSREVVEQPNIMGRMVYDNYLNVMPAGLTEEEQRNWMNMLGSSAAATLSLERVIQDHVESAVRTSRSRLVAEAKHKLESGLRTVLRMYNPPSPLKALLEATSRVNMWTHDDVAGDDTVTTTSIVLEALQIRERVTNAVRNIKFYNTFDYVQLAKRHFNMLIEDIEMLCMTHRAKVNAFVTQANHSRAAVAKYLLFEMRTYDDNVVPNIKVALQAAVGMLFTHDHITCEMLRESVSAQDSRQKVKTETQSQTTEERQKVKIETQSQTTEEKEVQTSEGPDVQAESQGIIEPQSQTSVTEEEPMKDDPYADMPPLEEEEKEEGELPDTEGVAPSPGIEKFLTPRKRSATTKESTSAKKAKK